MARVSLKVLHVFPGHGFGGLQKLVAELAVAQRERGIDAQLVSLYSDPAVLAYCMQRELPLTVTRGPARNPLAWLDLARALRRGAPDLVHLHVGLLWSNALGLALKSCPWVYHAHGYRSRRGFKANAQARILLRLCDAYISVSDSVGESVRTFVSPSPCVITVPNGLPLPTRQAMDRRKKTVGHLYGTACRLAEGKGVLEFVDVAAEIARLDRCARFLLAGSGELAGAVQERARAIGIADRLTMPGFVADVKQFWSSLDVAVFTAPRDGFGLSLIEPMLLGVPVAAYRTGAGSDEVLEDGRTGLMANWGDTRALARESVRLTSDRTLSARISMAARKRAEDFFSIEAMVEGVGAVYNNLLSSGC